MCMSRVNEKLTENKWKQSQQLHSQASDKLSSIQLRCTLPHSARYLIISSVSVLCTLGSKVMVTQFLFGGASNLSPFLAGPN